MKPTRYCVIVWHLHRTYDDNRATIEYRLHEDVSDYEWIVEDAILEAFERHAYVTDTIRSIDHEMRTVKHLSFRLNFQHCYAKWYSNSRPIPYLKARFCTGKYISVYDCSDDTRAFTMISRMRAHIARVAEAHNAIIKGASRREGDALEAFVDTLYTRMVSAQPITNYDI